MLLTEFDQKSYDNGLIKVGVERGREEERIKKAVTEATSGKASVTAEKELYYAILDKEVLTFED